MALNQPRGGVWDASDCALVLIDYQEEVLSVVFEQDRRVVELNAITLAKQAVLFDIPVVLSTVAVEMGANSPTIPALQAALPGVEPIDRSSHDAWGDDPAVRAAIRATGRRRLVMCGMVTSACLAYSAVGALGDGYEVTIVEDAVADITKEIHDAAIRRIVQAGAVPNTTQAMMAEWFRDWNSPLADHARELWPSYREEWAALKRDPQYQEPRGLVGAER
jgi:nicotinamidase-related amidase